MASIDAIATWLEGVVGVFPPNPEEKLDGDELVAVLHSEGVLRECTTAARAHYLVYGETMREDFNAVLQGVLTRGWETKPEARGQIHNPAVALYLVALGTILDRVEYYVEEILKKGVDTSD